MDLVCDAERIGTREAFDPRPHRDGTGADNELVVRDRLFAPPARR